EELTTRRGAGGKQRIGLAQVEVVTLDHERSRSLDPHAHRHLWLNAKVQGADGKWSNVDSQQVFRHQVLVNARGELAARTDTRWRAAL
ncbi:relaxase domain-containing protein, partial [Escherichia coli]|uniref:relaxase domain-containing protein n=2 Tax=Bacteria TaxID=2 RepID=UPI0028DDA933